MDERTCISVTELARKLGISRTSAFNLTNSDGFYPAFRIGKRIVVSAEAFDRWIAEQTAV